MRQVLAGLGISMLVAAGGLKARSLDAGGALAATLVGTAITAGTSWPGVATLGTFFISSSALSKVRPASHLAAKGSQRDAIQVLANGGVAAVAAAGLARVDRGLALTVAAGSLAAATADTWATEIGSSSGAVPRLLLSRRCVAPGESGGVTLPGTAASVAGSCLIAVVAAATGKTWSRGLRVARIVPAVVVAGIGGSLIDSVAGELLQERRYCRQCARRTELRIHYCGRATEHVAGVSGITNDAVNVMCTVSGAMIAFGMHAATRSERMPGGRRR